jgi:hypothetical protein
MVACAIGAVSALSSSCFADEPPAGLEIKEVGRWSPRPDANIVDFVAWNRKLFVIDNADPSSLNFRFNSLDLLTVDADEASDPRVTNIETILVPDEYDTLIYPRHLDNYLDNRDGVVHFGYRSFGSETFVDGIQRPDTTIRSLFRTLPGQDPIPDLPEVIHDRGDTFLGHGYLLSSVFETGPDTDPYRTQGHEYRGIGNHTDVIRNDQLTGYQAVFSDGPRVYFRGNSETPATVAFDYSDPAAPQQLMRFGGFDGRLSSFFIEIRDNIGYGYERLPNGTYSDLSIYDMSGEGEPVLLHRFDGYQGGTVAEDRDLLFFEAIDGESSQLKIFDVSDPRTPRLVLDQPSELLIARKVVFESDLIYVLKRLDRREIRIYEVTERTAGCNPADLAQPLGVLDLNDIEAFIGAFTAGDPAIDLAEPVGVVDLADLVVFIDAFQAGCP